MAIQDFGEKIGGARKDLWKERGLMLDDLLDMNEAEKLKFIKKDNVWKKPDYQELVDSGIPRRVVYFMKMMRDALPTKPEILYGDKTPEQIEIKQNGYITFVRDFRDAVMSLRTEEEVLHFYNDYLKLKYIESTPGRYYVNIRPEAYGCITNKLLKAVQVNNFYSIDRDIKKKQFCYTEEDIDKDLQSAFLNQFVVTIFDKEHVEIKKDYQGRDEWKITRPWGWSYFYPQNEDADVSQYKEGSVLVLQRNEVVAKNLESPIVAHEMLLNMFQESLKKLKEKEKGEPTKKTSKKRKTSFIPKQLQHVKREGQDFRKGKNVSGENYMEKFGFRGGEFGNWMNEKDRQISLNYGYDALLDMCEALEIDPKDISLNGRLAIAFGARGQKGAAAHYESGREVINLTKMKGAGSLAHEWAHALDDIIGKELGLNGFMSEKHRSQVVPQSLNKLVNSMQYKMSSGKEIFDKQQKKLENSEKNLRRVVDNEFAYVELSKTQYQRKEQIVNELIQKAKSIEKDTVLVLYDGSENEEIERLSQLKKEVTGHVISIKAKENLALYANSVKYAFEKIGKAEEVKTDFYANSIAFDSIHSKTDQGYWQSTIEMFARAFACYIYDKLNFRSDYLCGHANTALDMVPNKKTGDLEILKAFPEGEERVAINQCFDEFIAELKDMQLLHECVFEHEEVKEEKKEFVPLNVQIGAARKIQSKQENIKIVSEEIEKGESQLAFDFDL